MAYPLKAKNNMNANLLKLVSTKNIGLFFVVMFGLVSVSCSTEDSQSSNNDSVQLNENSITKAEKKSEQGWWDENGVVVYDSVDYNDDNEKDVLDELLKRFTTYLYVDLGFDSRNQIAHFEIEKHLNEQKYVLKYEVLKFDPLSYGLALGLLGEKYEMVAEDKEQLEIHCNGGADDGKYVLVDRPTGPRSLISLITEIKDFVIACLDNGGCLETCTASVVISNIGPAEDGRDQAMEVKND